MLGCQVGGGKCANVFHRVCERRVGLCGNVPESSFQDCLEPYWRASLGQPEQRSSQFDPPDDSSKQAVVTAETLPTGRVPASPKQRGQAQAFANHATTTSAREMRSKVERKAGGNTRPYLAAQ